RLLRLLSQMHPQVRFVHWRDWMSAHRWMTIQSKGLGFGPATGKQVAEDAIAPQRRSADDDRDERAVEDFSADVDRAADRADCWRGVERGASLVMHDGRSRVTQGDECGLKVLFHFVRRQRTRHSRHSKGAQPGKRF